MKLFDASWGLNRGMRSPLGDPPGPYEIFCLPICIKGADGAPARVLLREQRKEGRL